MSDALDLAFARLHGISLPRKKALVDRWGSVQRMLLCLQRKEVTDPVEKELIGFLAKNLERSWAQSHLKELQKNKIWVCFYGRKDYPSLLAEIADPPMALFGKGKLPTPGEPTLGFVGSRRPSTYGRRVAKWLATDLAREGVVLVSGMARGIDAIAHESALKSNQKNIAVLGSGLDQVYPPEHGDLQNRILSLGAVVTEFFLGEAPRPKNFPQRNRIISGLSQGVLVIEAGEKSGARITANHAVDQSRDVFAVPGPIDAPMSFYTNQLIAQGAKLVASSVDILEEFFPKKQLGENRFTPAQPDLDLSPVQKKLLNVMEKDVPSTPDQLAQTSHHSVGKVLQILTELELHGFVEKQADSRYVRIIGG